MQRLERTTSTPMRLPSYRECLVPCVSPAIRRQQGAGLSIWQAREFYNQMLLCAAIIPPHLTQKQAGFATSGHRRIRHHQTKAVQPSPFKAIDRLRKDYMGGGVDFLRNCEVIDPFVRTFAWLGRTTKRAYTVCGHRRKIPTSWSPVSEILGRKSSIADLAPDEALKNLYLGRKRLYPHRIVLRFPL